MLFRGDTDIAEAIVVRGTSSTYTASGQTPQAGAEVGTAGVGGLSLFAQHASGAIRFYSGGTTVRATLDASGNLAVDTDTLYVDATNNRVGIGTATPGAYVLDVAGVARIDQGSASGSTLTLNRSSNPGSLAFQFTGTETGQIQAVSGGGLNFYTGSTPSLKLTLDNSGDLGIGTNSPDYKLEVEGTGVVRSNIHSTSTGGIRNAALRLQVDSSGGDDPSGIIEFTYGAGATQCAAIDAVLNSAASAGILRFFTSTTERARIDASGNFGIGTSSPAEKLEVEFNTNGYILADNSTDTNTGIKFANTGRTYGIFTDGGSGSSNSLRFYDFTASAERLRLDSAGNLGLGVTPSAWSGLAFQISSGTAINARSGVLSQFSTNQRWDGANHIYLNDGAATLYTQNAGAHSWAVSASGTAGNNISFTTAMTLDASGNLGIGTSSPDAGAKLTVAGGILATGSFSATTGSTAGIDYNSANLRFFSMGSSGSTKGGYVWIAKGADNSSSTPMTLDASGNLLVGTTSANGILATSGRGYIEVNGTTDSAIGFESNGTLGGYLYNSATEFRVANYSNTPLTFQTNNLERARITAAGELLVGLTSGGKFSVSYGGNDTHFGLGANYDNYITAGSSGVTIFRNATTERARITAAGQLLVGISSPPATAAVGIYASANSVSYGAIGARNGAGPNTFAVLGDSNFECGYVGTSTEIGTSALLRVEGANGIQFTSSASEKARITASGNFGLGVTPSAWGLGKAFEVTAAGNAIWGVQASDIRVCANMYYDGTNYKYVNTNFAARYDVNGGGTGGHAWLTAPSGTAGTVISWTQAMTLTAAGNLGVGTTSPSVNGIDIVRSGGTSTYVRTSDGTYTMFSGVAPALGGGLVGTISNSPLILYANNAERARITAGGYSKFSNDGSYIDSAGNYHEFRQTTNDAATIYASNTNASSPYGLRVHYTAAAPNNTDNWFLFCGDSSTRAVIRSNGGLANYQSNNLDLSDERTKKDITPAPSYWDKIGALEIVTYKYNDQTHDDVNVGVIAQQVEAVEPVWVDSDGFGETPEGEEPLKTVYTKDITFAAIKALQEAMTRIEELEAKVAALESK